MRDADFLLECLTDCKTSFHTIKKCEEVLVSNGYEELKLDESWDGKLNREENISGRFFVKPFASMLVAFCISQNVKSLKFGFAHVDHPCLKLKSNPDMERAGYHMANIEPYGGLIMNTWFDRPLCLGGKVVVKGEEAFAPIELLYDSKKPEFIIPNLAPHLKRDDKDGKMDPQKELIPICGLKNNKDIISVVAEELGVLKADILDYDLYLYDPEKPEIIGFEDDMISSPRIDDISSVAALLENSEVTPLDNSGYVIAFFDNEEIGSRSKQGADSVLLSNVVDLILEAFGKSKQEKMAILNNSFELSLDVAHGIHPNYTEKSDPTNQVRLGDGVVLKTSASQRYVSDSKASAIITAISDESGIKIQKQVNKSGMAGGQTLGPVAASYLPVLGVDMGVPVLAMHSARELAAVSDYNCLKELIRCVFSM